MPHGAKRVAVSRAVRLALMVVVAAVWLEVLSLTSGFIGAAIHYNSFLESRPAETKRGIEEVGRKGQRGEHLMLEELRWLGQQAQDAATAREPLAEARGNIASLCLGFSLLLFVGAAAYWYIVGGSIPKALALALV